MRDVETAQWLRRGSLPVMRLMAISALATAAVCMATSADAQDRHGHGGPDGHAMMMFGGPPEHVGRAVDRMLDGLSATESQRSQIKQISVAAAADLKVQREAGRGLRERAMKIFSAPTVDASAAEMVRQQMSAQEEQGSKRTLQAMLDVAKVLTPEQRAKIAERTSERQAVMQDRRQRMQQDRRERAARGFGPATPPVPQK